MRGLCGGYINGGLGPGCWARLAPTLTRVVRGYEHGGRFVDRLWWLAASGLILTLHHAWQSWLWWGARLHGGRHGAAGIGVHG